MACLYFAEKKKSNLSGRKRFPAIYFFYKKTSCMFMSSTCCPYEQDRDKIRKYLEGPLQRRKPRKTVEFTIVYGYIRSFIYETTLGRVNKTVEISTLGCERMIP